MAALQVLPHLYISAQEFSRKPAGLQQLNITHILAVGSGLDAMFPDDFAYKKVDILDEDDQDLLAILPGCIAFIEEGLARGAVLVHCVAGVSRSVAVVTAYIMRRENMDLESALTIVRSGHPNACPNDGFMQQLHMFHAMNFTLEGRTDAHRQYRIRKAEMARNATGHVAATELPSLDSDESSYASCNRCRQKLFAMSNVVPHESTTTKMGFEHKNRDSRIMKGAECTSFFIEPISWMGQLQDVEGKISCPNSKCPNKIGSWNWFGMQCSCGAWVAPSFQIHKSKVDIRQAAAIAAGVAAISSSPAHSSS
eukprot:GILK01002236.1.p1 GENE.GILK01002236.1~~GILK01002236.1.p1  ORF type:complete len:326 (+),score=56.94 GILK01002236.1:49-978(+)